MLVAHQFRAERILQRFFHSDVNTRDDENADKHPDARREEDDRQRHGASERVAGGELVDFNGPRATGQGRQRYLVALLGAGAANIKERLTSGRAV